MFFKTEDVVSAAKRSEFFPVGQTTFTDPDDLIALANEELYSKIVPSIMKVREDFFFVTKQVNIVGNVDTYTLPERAIGSALKDVRYAPSATDPGTSFPLPKTTLHDMSYSGQGAPAVVCFRGDQVLVMPKPSQSIGALLMDYYARPNQLVATSNCAKVTAISVGTTQTTFTVDTDLTAATVSTILGAGSLVDLLSAKSPFMLWGQDVAVQSITAGPNQIVLNNSDVQDGSGATLVKVGDYICPAQTACIPMVPSEFHYVLSEMVAWRALKAIGDQAHAAACKAHIQEQLSDALSLISMRIEMEMDVLYERGSILNSIGMPNLGITVK